MITKEKITGFIKSLFEAIKKAGLKTAIIVFAVLFIGGAIIFKVFSFDILPSQFYGAFIGVIITALVTAFLLRGQTEGDEKREKSIRVYEEQLHIYKDFLSKLHEIVKEGNITPDNLKELIFQLSYVAMHTSSERIINVLKKSKEALVDFNSKSFGQLAQNLFEVVLVFQEELYDEKPGKKINDEKISSEVFSVLDDLIINVEKATNEVQQSNEVVDINKVEIQTYFWTELIEQLKKKNYAPIWAGKTSIEQDVAKYYTISRPRYRYIGFEFDFYPSKSGKNVKFSVNLDNEYCYGFLWSDNKNDEKLTQIVKQVSSKYNSNQLWGGWRWPDYSEEKTRHDLNFWKFIQHSGMKRLLDQSKREELIKEIANEMDEQIRKFIEIAQKNNL